MDKKGNEKVAKDRESEQDVYQMKALFRKIRRLDETTMKNLFNFGIDHLVAFYIL